jgi:hypothetical protein
MQQIRTNTVAAVAATICIAGALPVAAHALSCPANSNALGTSRILVVAPTDYMRLGNIIAGTRSVKQISEKKCANVRAPFTGFGPTAELDATKS